MEIVPTVLSRDRYSEIELHEVSIEYKRKLLYSLYLLREAQFQNIYFNMPGLAASPQTV